MLKNGSKAQAQLLDSQFRSLLSQQRRFTVPRCTNSNFVRRIATSSPISSSSSHSRDRSPSGDRDSFSFFRDGKDPSKDSPRGGSSRAKGERFGQKSKFRSNNRISYQSRPNTPVNFASPTNLNRSELDRKLYEAVRSFYNETSTHLTNRLVSFGLKGEAIRWLLAAVQHATSKDTKNQIKGKGSDSWKREMTDRGVLDDEEVVARLARSWCRLASKQLEPRQFHPEEFDGDNQTVTARGDGFTSVSNWQYNAISDSMLYEGDSALPRIVISEFLAWLQKELTTFTDGKANFRKKNQSDRSMEATSDIGVHQVGSPVEKPSKTYSSAFYFKAPPKPLDSDTLALLSSSASTILCNLSSIISASDLSHPALRFSNARVLTRKIHLHVGPTNSGKTHAALVALTKAKTGIFAGPLRLLAHEVFERINAGTVSPGVKARPCNLLTGEEQRIVDRLAGVVACTVEMTPVDTNVEVAVVDEIQMIGDPQRGAAWTNAVLGLAAKELHLCGEPSVIPLIQTLAESCGDDLEIHRYERLTPLKVAEDSLSGKLKNVKKGDCVVTFSRSGIFSVKAKIEQETGLKCAVVYGGLPPETKSEQARLFNESGNGWDVMVASDAVGMGLNLKIKRVVFETMSKWNGTEQVFLSSSQIKQIAGRAGRYGTTESSTTSAESGSVNEPEDAPGGIATTLHPEDLEVLKKAMEAPVVPVARAALSPNSEMLGKLSVMLPPTQTTSTSANSQNFLLTTKSPSRGTKPLILPPAYTTQPDSSLSSIYANVSVLTKIDTRTYFLEDFSQQQILSPLVERAARSLPFPSPPSPSSSHSKTETGTSQLSAKDQLKLSLSRPIPNSKMSVPSLLSLEERELLSSAPADVKNPLVVNWYHGAIKNLAEGRLVDFEETEEEMGLNMVGVLEEVENLQKSKRESKPAVSDASGDQEQQVQPNSEMSSNLGPQVNEKEEEMDSEIDANEPNATTEVSDFRSYTPFTPSIALSSESERIEASVSALTLATLESLHRSLSVYLWLSFRFPLSFCYRLKVELLKKRTEVAIEWGLEDMRNSRKDRLKKLGRGEEDEQSRKAEKRKRKGKGKM